MGGVKASMYSFFRLTGASEDEKVSAFLVFYRWANWLLALIFLIVGFSPKIPPARAWSLIIFVFLYNFALGRYHSSIYKRIKKQPLFLGLDYLVCFSLVALSGGWRSPYYLYSFSPTLLAALLCKTKGGFMGASISAFLNLLALALNGYGPERLINMGYKDDLIADQLSFFLVGIFFTYPAILMERLDKNRVILEKTKRDLESQVEILKSIYTISTIFASKLKVQDALKEIAESAREITSANQAGVCLCVEETNGLCLDLSTLEIVGIKNKGRRKSRREKEMIDAIQECFEDVSCCPKLLNGKAGKKEWLVCFPLEIQDEKIGVLVLVAPSIFDDRDKMVMEILASFGTVAIKNAWLVEEKQKILLVDERRRIAGDMHDKVVQALFGVNMGMEICGELIHKDPEEVVKTLEGMQKEISHVMKIMRDYIYDLQKVDLVEEVGLSRACERCVERFNEIYQTNIKFNVSGIEKSLSSKAQKTVCYVMREALYNVIKHAEANSIDASLVYNKKAVKLTVCDDGKGFDVRKTFLEAEERGSMGLFGIKDKAEVLGGSLNIVSSVEGGTRIELTIPTEWSSDETS